MKDSAIFSALQNDGSDANKNVTYFHLVRFCHIFKPLVRCFKQFWINFVSQRKL